MRVLTITVLLALGTTSVSMFGQVPILPSAYSELEIRDGARAGDRISERKPHSAMDSLKAAQFSGYVNGFIDAMTDGPSPDPTLAECIRTKPRPRIVQRIAMLLADPNDKAAGSVRFDVGFAAAMACDDKYWGAKTATTSLPVWSKFGENGRLVAYFQRGPDGPPALPVAWVLYDYKSEQQSERSNRRYWSEKASQEVDCAQARTRTTFFTWHRGKMGDGQVVYTGRNVLAWEPNAPGSIGAALASAVCGNR